VATCQDAQVTGKSLMISGILYQRLKTMVEEMRGVVVVLGAVT
jgi:hypothetical protein